MHVNNQDLRTRSSAGVPLSIYAVHQPVQRQRARDADVVLRAGPVDDRSPHAAGRAPLRPSVELVPRADVEPASRFFPGATFARTDGVTGYNDITPRFGAAYDLFGNGKTALKVNLGKYLQGASVSNLAYNANPALRIPRRRTRRRASRRRFANPYWRGTGLDADADFVPDCSLSDSARQRRMRPDRQPAFGSTQLDRCAVRSGPAQRVGRPSVGLVVRRVGAAGDLPACVGGGRLLPPHVHDVHDRRHGHRQPGDLAGRRRRVHADGADATHVCPDGGGYTVGPLYNLNPNVFGQVEPADQSRRRTSATTRACSTASTSPSTCATPTASRSRAAPAPARWRTTGATSARPCRRHSPAEPVCHIESPFQTSFRALATYTIPRIDVQVSTVFQDKPNIGTDQIASLVANYTLTPADQAAAAAQIGRPLTTTGAADGQSVRAGPAVRRLASVRWISRRRRSSASAASG